MNAPPCDPGNPDGHGRTVLLAEDSASVSLLVRSLLARWDFAVTERKCDETAMRALTVGAFDLIVIGASSPNAPMVAGAAAERAPIVALVANGLALAQATASVAMPFNAAGLRDAVRSCLMATDQDIDAAMLAALWESASNPIFKRVARVFVDEIHNRMLMLEEHYAKAAFEAVENEAHAIKGAASNVAALHLRDTAARVEQAAARGDATALPSLITALRETGMRAITAIERLLERDIQS